MGEWDPLRESLCEFVSRLRVEQAMQDYDDTREATIGHHAAHGLYWHERPPDNQLSLGLTVIGDPGNR